MHRTTLWTLDVSRSMMTVRWESKVDKHNDAISILTWVHGIRFELVNRSSKISRVAMNEMKNLRILMLKITRILRYFHIGRMLWNKHTLAFICSYIYSLTDREQNIIRWIVDYDDSVNTLCKHGRRNLWTSMYEDVSLKDEIFLMIFVVYYGIIVLTHIICI